MLSEPSTKSLDSYTDHAYDKIFPFMYTNLVQRYPGEFISSDGTFRTAKITISEGKIVVCFVGENNDIVGWCAALHAHSLVHSCKAFVIEFLIHSCCVLLRCTTGTLSKLSGGKIWNLQ